MKKKKKKRLAHACTAARGKERKGSMRRCSHDAIKGKRKKGKEKSSYAALATEKGGKKERGVGGGGPNDRRMVDRRREGSVVNHAKEGQRGKIITACEKKRGEAIS